MSKSTATTPKVQVPLVVNVKTTVTKTYIGDELDALTKRAKAAYRSMRQQAVYEITQSLKGA